MEKFVVIKLISSEEIVCTQIEDNDYEISTLFPMLVKSIPKLIEGRISESITLAPYTYFASDDQFTFQKNQIIFVKDLSERYYESYKLAIDDFVANSIIDEPQTIDDVVKSLNRLAETFGDQIENIQLEEDINTDSIFLDTPNKNIH